MTAPGRAGRPTVRMHPLTLPLRSVGPGRLGRITRGVGGLGHGRQGLVAAPCAGLPPNRSDRIFMSRW